MYLSLSNDQAEVFHHWGVKRAFGNLQGQTIFMKLLKDASCLIMMESKGTTSVNAEVIHVNFKPSFSHHIRDDMIHESLEHGGCIAETEEHDCRFIESEGGDEGSFSLI